MEDESAKIPGFKFHKLQLKRFRDVTRFEDLHLDKIKRAILVVYATWAGPSMKNQQRLEILKSLDLSLLEFIYLDTDCIPDYIRLFGHVLGGAAEIFWVRDGKFVAECSPWSKMTDEEILTQTKALLQQ